MKFIAGVCAAMAISAVGIVALRERSSATPQAPPTPQAPATPQAGTEKVTPQSRRWRRT